MEVNNKRHKQSNAEMDLILETVIEMLLKGLSRTDILRHFAENENFKKSERSVDYYIDKSKKEIKERFKPEKENLKALSIARYEDLYKKNYQIQDYRECRQIIDSVSKLFGLNEPTTVKNQLLDENGNPTNPNQPITIVFKESD